MSRFVGAFLLIIGFTFMFANNVSPSKASKFYVRVVVSSEHHSSEIESYMNSALRNLGDVVIDREQPTHEISVVHLRTDISRMNVFSVVVRGTIPRSYLNPELDNEHLSYILNNAFFIDKEHIYASGPSIPLKTECESIIAGIDASVLELLRQGRQRRRSMSQVTDKPYKAKIPKEAEYLFEGLED